MANSGGSAYTITCWEGGTSNVGPVTGGEGRPAGDATNVVTDYVRVEGESRSHDAKFCKEITAAYKVEATRAIMPARS